MFKNISAAAAVLVALAAGYSLVRAADSEPAKPKFTIKQIMKKAHKDGMMKKLALGEGTKEDARELVEMYEALGENKPPRGDVESWKAKTAALVAAAQEVLDGKEGAGNRLRKAADCAGCHKIHKGE